MTICLIINIMADIFEKFIIAVCCLFIGVGLNTVQLSEKYSFHEKPPTNRTERDVMFAREIIKCKQYCDNQMHKDNATIYLCTPSERFKCTNQTLRDLLGVPELTSLCFSYDNVYASPLKIYVNESNIVHDNNMTCYKNTYNSVFKKIYYELILECYC